MQQKCACLGENGQPNLKENLSSSEHVHALVHANYAQEITGMCNR